MSRVKLEGEELARRLAELPSWKLDNGRIQKSFSFPDFQTGLDFVNRVGAEAERQGHHPDIHLTWGRVDVEISTHDAGGLTASDFALAAGTDQAFREN